MLREIKETIICILILAGVWILILAGVWILFEVLRSLYEGITC